MFLLCSKWQSTPAQLPGKSHGLRSLISYSPWGRKESDTTKRLHFTFFKYWDSREHVDLISKAVESSKCNLFLWNCGCLARHWGLFQKLSGTSKWKVGIMSDCFRLSHWLCFWVILIGGWWQFIKGHEKVMITLTPGSNWKSKCFIIVFKQPNSNANIIAHITKMPSVPQQNIPF